MSMGLVQYEFSMIDIGAGSLGDHPRDRVLLTIIDWIESPSTSESVLLPMLLVRHADKIAGLKIANISRIRNSVRIIHSVKLDG
jgi:hypothetical protein